MHTQALVEAQADIIGGLALAFVLVLFRRRILRTFFRNVEIGLAYRLLALFFVLTEFIAIAVFGVWMYLSRSS